MGKEQKSGVVPDTWQPVNHWWVDIEPPPPSRRNFTDIKVVHDPVITKPQSGREFSMGNSGKTNSNSSTAQIHGILVPVIDLNGRPLSVDVLTYMMLSFNHFTPKLTIRFMNDDRRYTFTGGLSLNNKVSVIIVPASEGVARKMSIPFYIVKQTNLADNEIELECEYYHIGLWKTACEQIGEEPLNTYKFCELISKQLQLGFAATDKCKDIEDKRWRQVYSQRISTFIEEQISIGGLDENSIFEAWIDPFGYLNLANLAWVFDVEVFEKDLVMILESYNQTPIETKEKPIGDRRAAKRCITNDTTFPVSGNKIAKYYTNLTTENTTNTGVFRNCWILKDAGGTNSLELQNIHIIENSLEGLEAPQSYESQTTEFLGVEMSEDVPYLYQKEIRKSFLTKKRSKQITVELETPNYIFQRGMLIMMTYLEYDQEKIKLISSNMENLNTVYVKQNSKRTVTKERVEQDLTELEKPKMCDTEALADDRAILNPTLTGFFYIDGIDYYYDSEIKQIKQYMYLIKRGNTSSLVNPNTLSGV